MRTPSLESKYPINQFFKLHDPLYNLPLPKTEFENNFLPATEKNTLELLQKSQNPGQSLDNSYLGTKKTKLVKANITILVNKTLLI